MTKQVPTTAALPKLAKYLAGEDVELADWKAINEALHYEWARTGCVCAGPVFDAPWETASTTYVTANSATQDDYHLDHWQGVFRFQRMSHETGTPLDIYRIKFDCYAKNLDVRCTMTRLDTQDGHTGSSTAFTNLTTSHAAADSEWQGSEDQFTPAEAARGGTVSNGNAYFLVYVEAKVPATGTGYLYGWALRESKLTSGSTLPAGD